MKNWMHYECIEQHDDFKEGEKKSIAFTDLDGGKNTLASITRTRM